MPGKRVQFDDETWRQIDLLGRDQMKDFQELADEAFRDLLKKHGRPVDQKDALRRSAGDIVILPAGTGHQRLASSKDFLVVGAYPASGTYDECRGTTEEHERSVRSVEKAGRPGRDPIFGAKGPLLKLWKAKR